MFKSLIIKGYCGIFICNFHINASLSINAFLFLSCYYGSYQLFKTIVIYIFFESLYCSIHSVIHIRESFSSFFSCFIKSITWVYDLLYKHKFILIPYASLSRQGFLMVFHFGDSKSLYIPRTLLSIQIILSNDIVWMVSFLLRFTNFPAPFIMSHLVSFSHEF